MASYALGIKSCTRPRRLCTVLSNPAAAYCVTFLCSLCILASKLFFAVLFTWDVLPFLYLHQAYICSFMSFCKGLFFSYSLWQHQVCLLNALIVGSHTTSLVHLSKFARICIIYSLSPPFQILGAYISVYHFISSF